MSVAPTRTPRVARTAKPAVDPTTLDRDDLDVSDLDGDTRFPPTEDNIAALKLKPFKVIRSTIRDNLNRYVGEDSTETEGGDVAYLNAKTARHYLDHNFIRVELPEDFEDADTNAAND